MPTYEHRCNAEGCGHEWDEFYSMKDDPPTECPSCNLSGHVQRLISGGSGKGIMVLKGGELRDKLMSDAKQARARARTDENYRANIFGEDKYHNQQLQKDKLTDDLVRIGKDASKIKSTSTKKNPIVKRSGSKN